MKKKIYFIIIIIGIVALIVFFSYKKKQFGLQEEAYSILIEVDDATSKISHDILVAWEMAIYQKGRFTYNDFRRDLYMDGGNLTNGILKTRWLVVAAIKKLPLIYEDASPSDMRVAFDLFEDVWNSFSEFSDYVYAVIDAYESTSKFDKLFEDLESVKQKIQEINKSNVSTEEFDNLKEYYTTVLSFLELCRSPKGNLTNFQLEEHEYLNKTRTLRNRLDLAYSK